MTPDVVRLRLVERGTPVATAVPERAAIANRAGVHCFGDSRGDRSRVAGDVARRMRPGRDHVWRRGLDIDAVALGMPCIMGVQGGVRSPSRGTEHHECATGIGVSDDSTGAISTADKKTFITRVKLRRVVVSQIHHSRRAWRAPLQSADHSAFHFLPIPFATRRDGVLFGSSQAILTLP